MPAADCASKLHNVKIIGMEGLRSVAADLAVQDTTRLEPPSVAMATVAGLAVKSFVNAPAVPPSQGA